MDREELERRYRETQFKVMGQMAEHQTEQAEHQTDNEPAAPTLAQIMGVKPRPDTYLTPDDRLRRWAGLK